MKTYTYKYNNVKATATYDGNHLVLLKGSTIVGDNDLTDAFLTRPENSGRRELRDRLISEKKLVKYGDALIFTEDLTFHSPSQAATIVAGSSKNGPLEFGLPTGFIATQEKNTEYQYFDIDNKSAVEGYKKDTIILSSQRNQKLVKSRKEFDLYICQVCGFNLEISGKYVIECHHLNPLAKTGATETSISDLISLCPTCHRVAHLRKPPYTPREIAKILKSNITNSCT